MADAVTVLPFIPKETLLELDRTTADRFCDVVPALRFTFVSDVATDAVTVLALSPKLMPFALPKAKALARFDVVPALMFRLPWVLATDALAVTVLPLSPKLTLLEFESTKALRLFATVPAERFTAVKLVAMLAVILLEPDMPKLTPLALEKTTVPEFTDCVPADSAAPPPPPPAAEAVMVEPDRPRKRRWCWRTPAS